MFPTYFFREYQIIDNSNYKRILPFIIIYQRFVSFITDCILFRDYKESKMSADEWGKSCGNHIFID